MLVSTLTKLAKVNFHMSEKQGRETENSRRMTEMYRVESIQDEMASAVRFLGGSGSAKEQNRRAAKDTGLSINIIERLRWRKIKRPFTDISDAVRDAVERRKEESLRRAQHEVFIARREAAVMAARLAEIDPDFYGPEIDTLRRTAASDRLPPD